jgi:hypothetical protein
MASSGDGYRACVHRAVLIERETTMNDNSMPRRANYTGRSSNAPGKADLLSCSRQVERQSTRLTIPQSLGLQAESRAHLYFGSR